MTIKTLELTKQKLTLLITDVEVPVVNALRRALIRDVPTMAIEDVYLTKNESPIFDEMIAHRLGLIPLTTEPSYTMRENCTCKAEGCSKCQVTLILKKQGPGLVLASDFESSDPKVKPIIGDIPITYLNENQAIELEAKAQLGTGKEHTKWSPGRATHAFAANITINPKSVTKDSKKVADASKDALVFSAGKLSVNKTVILSYDELDAALDSVNQGEVTLEPDRNAIILSFENWGQLSHKQAFETALDIVLAELKELKEGLGE